MKKALVILVALALAAPLYAGTITLTATDNEDGTCNIDWSSTGAVVAMGMDIDVTGTPPNDEPISGVAVDAWFDIYMDAAYDEEAGDGYRYGEGTPIADQDAPGQLVLPQSIFCISMGGLGGETGPLTPAPSSGTIVMTADGIGFSSGTIVANALRGGVVDDNGAEVTITGDSTWTITSGDCMTALGVDVSNAALYATFLLAGSPACWCDEFNCAGDADGLFSGIDAAGKRKWVTLPDLNILSDGWTLKESAYPYFDVVCADADRAFTGINAAGKRKWITLPDLNILSDNWTKKSGAYIHVPCDGY